MFLPHVAQNFFHSSLTFVQTLVCITAAKHWPPEGAATHQGSRGFSIYVYQVDFVFLLLLLPLLLLLSAAALDADAQAAEHDQQSGGHKDDVNGPSRYCRKTRWGRHTSFSCL